MSAENTKFQIHNLWAHNRLSKTKSPTLNTHEAFLCLAPSFLVTGAQPHTWVLSVNAFGKSHNKRLSRQSQHFRKPLIIFRHLKRAKHRKSLAFSTHTVDLFKTSDVNQQLKRGHRAPTFKSLWPGQKSRRIDFTPRTYFVRPTTSCEANDFSLPTA